MVRAAVLGILVFLLLKAGTYCFGFLNAHPERKEIPQAEAEEIQKGHLAHMAKMNKEGHLLAAGPMMTPGGPRGILIYRCKSTQEAEEWTALDPAVVNKRLTSEFYLWSAPDGIGEPLLTMLKSDPNAKYNMVKLPFILARKTEKWTGAGPGEVLQKHGMVVPSQLRDGTIRTAGPFVDDKGQFGQLPVVGLYIYSAMPLEKAKAIADQDPLVRDGFAKIDAMELFIADEVIPKAPASSAGSAAPR